MGFAGTNLLSDHLSCARLRPLLPMTDCPLIGRYSPRFARLWHCLARVALLACVLLVPRAALAAAPMCDPSGASMVAPVPAPPSATGDLVAQKSCETGHDGMDVA